MERTCINVLSHSFITINIRKHCMKHLFLLLSLITNTLMAQEVNQSLHRVIVGTGVGVGLSVWHLNSPFVTNFQIDGVNVPICVDAFYQYKRLRVGVGVSFEKLYVDQSQNVLGSFLLGLHFKNNQVSFRKFYAQAEYILINGKTINFGLSTGAGVYRLDKTFSQKHVGGEILMFAGLFGEYKFKNKLIINVKPHFELKYHQVIDSHIDNTILSVNLTTSLRYDIF